MLISCSDCIQLAVCRVLLQRVGVDFVRRPDLASLLVLLWRFHGTLRRLMYTELMYIVQLDSVGVVWTSWALLAGGRRWLWSAFYKGGMNEVCAH